MMMCPHRAPAHDVLRPRSPLRPHAFRLCASKYAIAASATLICNQGVGGSSPSGGTM